MTGGGTDLSWLVSIITSPAASKLTGSIFGAGFVSTATTGAGSTAGAAKAGSTRVSACGAATTGVSTTGAGAATTSGVRVTATGQLYACLGGTEQVDLRAALRSDEPDVQLSAALDRAMAIKPERHHFAIRAPGAAPALPRHMSLTGG